MGDESELVSIIVPTLNEEEHISDLIKSIHFQSYRPIEIIVVDDGSSDRTVELVEQFAEALKTPLFKIRLLRGKDFGKGKSGPAYVRNIGISNSRGQYILFFDADQVLLSKELVYEAVEALKNTYSAVACKQKVIVDSCFEYNLMLDSGNPPFRSQLPPLVGFKSNTLSQIRYDEELGVGEDIDLILRLLKHSSLRIKTINGISGVHLPHNLKEYRIQKVWYGRSSLLYIKKCHDFRSVLGRLSPILPTILIILTLFSILVNAMLSFAFFGVFLSLLFFFLVTSSVKSPSRVGYLLFRFTCGSFFFTFGVLLGFFELCVRGTIEPSRKNLSLLQSSDFHAC